MRAIGLRPPALVPHDALIKPRWSTDPAHRRPRSPHRRIVPAMLPLILCAGLARPARAPRRAPEGTGVEAALSPRAKLHTFFD